MTKVSESKQRFTYLIASGWWSCDPEEDGREKLMGDHQIRDVAFHQLWRECVDRFSNPDEILVIDSASPKKPKDVSGETWISLRKNFGHSTNHQTKYCGVSRSFIASMMYAFVNDYDYWVYVEQDAAIYGDGIVDLAVESASSGIAIGCGEGTPQPIQQSMMVFKKDRILEFIFYYDKINALDSEISPEWKFVFALNSFARYLPSSVLKWLTYRSRYKLVRRVKRYLLKLVQLFNVFNYLPFGYGRSRPLDLNASHYYFQHGSDKELREFKENLKNTFS